MEKTLQARLNADQRGESFCTKYNDQLITVDEYPAEILSFKAKVKKVEDAAQVQATNTKVITADKAIDKQGLADVIYKYELRGSMKAHQLGLVELELSLDNPLSFIGDATGLDAITRATNLKEIMHDNIGVLTNITEDNITEMEGAIGSFSGIKNANKSAVDVKKSTGPDVWDGLLNEAEVPRTHIEKIVYSYFPDLAHEWDLAIKVGKAAGIRHQDLVFKYVDYDTNVVLNKIKTSMVMGTTRLLKHSTVLGFSRGYGMESGNWEVTSSDPRYVTDVQTNVGIGDGVVSRVIRLKKVG